MNIKKLFTLFLPLFLLSSCGDNENNETENGQYSIDVKNDIEYFNIETGEIGLKSGQIVSDLLSSIEQFQSKIGSSSVITFYLDDNPVFESIPMQTEYSSLVINDLVFVIKDTKLFYLLDGYPSLEVLGDSKSASGEVRNENFEKRKENWDNFINYLQSARKIVE